MFNEHRIDQVYLALGPTDLRKSIDGLSIIVQEKFKLDPFSRNLYVFCNRKQDKIKILEWSSSGFWLHYKRLEKEKFRWPDDVKGTHIAVDERSFRWLLDGLTIRERYAHEPVKKDKYSKKSSEITDLELFLSFQKWYNNSMKTTENTAIEPLKEMLTQEEKLARLEQENEELKAEINFFKEQFKLSQLQKYGKSSEKSHPEQLVLFNEAEIESVKKCEDVTTEEVLVKRKKKKNSKGKNFEDLPIEEIHYELSDEEKICPKCDHALHEMKTEIRKEIVVIPAQIKVLHHKKQIYACRACDQEGTTGTIISAPTPKSALPGSFASSSVLAYTIEKKYNQAIPLYRQEASFKNLGYEISRQNLANWTIKASDRWLRILYDRMHQLLLKESIIHADETTLNVLDEKENKNNYMWLYTTAKESNHKICLYDYQKSRSKKNPIKFLNGFTGYLQTDGYQAYESVKDVNLLGCLAHARRYFKKALDAAPKEADISKSKSSEALSFFTRIYKLEKSFKDLSPSERFFGRISKTEPVMLEFHNWLQEESRRTLPKSLLGQAIKYNLKQWPKLIGVLCDGRLELDNNRALSSYYFYPHLLMKAA